MDQVVLDLKADCLRGGRGRKAWWARQLGIPPLTLSHWLAGRQRPNGRNALTIREMLGQLEQRKKCGPWEDYLWDCYYSKQDIPSKILSLVAIEILSAAVIGVRTAALMVRFFQKQRPSFEKPSSGTLRNRAGWLLEAAGLEPSFSPDRLTKVQSVFLSPSRQGSLDSYFRRNQTPIGRKWKIYDCSLDETLKSIP